MDWESSGVVGFDLWFFLQGQTRIAKVKGANNSLIIGPRRSELVNQPIENHKLENF